MKQPVLPVITGVDTGARKSFLTETLEDGAKVNIEGEELAATLLDATTLRTQKRKLKWAHQIYVVTSRWRAIATFQLVLHDPLTAS